MAPLPYGVDPRVSVSTGVAFASDIGQQEANVATFTNGGGGKVNYNLTTTSL